MNTCYHKLVTAFVTSATLFSSPLVMAVDCGDVITTAETLSETLNCELSLANPYAVTVTGPGGSLTMAEGGEIICDNPNLEGIAGILVNGLSGAVYGGTITDCPDGLNLEGDGFHTIDGIMILNSPREGIVIDSDSNNIVGNQIIDTGNDDGIDVRGDRNQIINNYIESAGDQGITVNGVFTLIQLNTIVGSTDGDNGIDINESNTTVIQNFVTGSASNGIELNVDVSSTSIIQNIVMENGTNGSPDTAGINIAGFNNENNVVVGNTSLDNSAFDLRDPTDPTCSGSNTWIGNTHVTAEPACLD
ncbi:right-handed parallel beta-helix repeat-containing protein [Microbulbifer sp. ZKSA002]|uniref:right-handed parallel beta-helix repeat-containing protein n=1 Tax=Microbulbifer sp. ZKSA002 TaxID=3243388 RepID=UPI0040397038